MKHTDHKKGNESCKDYAVATIFCQHCTTSCKPQHNTTGAHLLLQTSTSVRSRVARVAGTRSASTPPAATGAPAPRATRSRPRAKTASVSATYSVVQQAQPLERTIGRFLYAFLYDIFRALPNIVTPATFSTQNLLQISTSARLCPSHAGTDSV